MYLRRIFETLIEKARSAARDVAAFDNEAYERVRMDERILLLKGHLPDFLVENRRLYSILSKGIHSLSEEECLAYFATVRTGIELILDEQLARTAREEKLLEATKEIGALHGKLGEAGTS